MPTPPHPVADGNRALAQLYSQLPAVDRGGGLKAFTLYLLGTESNLALTNNLIFMSSMPLHQSTIKTGARSRSGFEYLPLTYKRR